MGFEVVGFQKSIGASQLKPGDKITGYAVGKTNTEQYPEVDCVELIAKGSQPEVKKKDGSVQLILDGEKFTLLGSGNVKYFFKNGNQLGYLYQFTYNGKKKNKRGQDTHDFSVAVDKSQKIQTASEKSAAAMDHQEDIGF